ncbi:MAG: type I restriction enzyme M protein [Parcubacteria group bacterium Gr01-1014_30]|nr:MAG: type I restriction enzyme M protein [Parcubacteria group bacterium Gr01-1014_30]
MATYHQISNTIWNIANHLRGGWKAHEYQDVILPLTVLKRLDAVLEPTKQKTLERYNELHGKVNNLNILCRVTGYNFYNTSQFTFKNLLEDPTHIARNLEKYIDGFSPNVKEIFEKFEFYRQLERLHGSNILYLILQEFDKIDLHPERVPNHIIGLAFEDLIRRFAEQSNETAGEHYTPRDVVRLMAALIFTGEEKELSKPGKVITIYDPACGTGGMLSIGSDYVKENINSEIKAHLFGQELNPVTFAICKADILLQNEGKDPEGIKGGEKENDKASTLSNDQHADKKFDYIISNPPYGVEWKKDKEVVEHEAERGLAGRFGAGLPRISDGQFLFIQHAISKFRPKTDGGSNAAIITNGSPLFTGDAGGGESEIRRWILKNNLLEAIVAMPEQLFFNTGIATYIWIFSNRKDAERKGKIQLVDARKIRTQLRRNLGAKRYEISEENAKEILKLYSEFKENERCKIFPNTEFAYREITIQRPLRLKFEITDESLTRLKEHKDFMNDRPSKKSGEKGEAENKAWRKLRVAIYEILETMRGKKYVSRSEFLKKLEVEAKKQEIKIPKKTLKTIWQEIGERDEDAEICYDEDGKLEPDKELKDFERVLWGQDIHDYFEREVKPYAPDAWIDETVHDAKDGKIGIVGYEIPFTRYFYEYKPLRPLEKISAEIKTLENEITGMLTDL